MSIEQAVDKCGPKNTPVNLLIYREGWDKPKEFKITRDVIKVMSAKSEMLDNETGYIRIIQFRGQTTEELEKALKTLRQGGSRNCPRPAHDPGGPLTRPWT
jgi:carboxyl-terminal processing protease